ncbi:hypothetical protein EVAR_68098_1 [Eumeta japonica]|uniref:Uncharacterized protein n=1 Tax=Eumeta variegata TaxID=151549 RepID=A0A4C2A5D5_EUMVA|nr:hypothetical protein EVAR_68098_1 [Eumeta japonica]
MSTRANCASRKAELGLKSNEGRHWVNVDSVTGRYEKSDYSVWIGWNVDIVNVEETQEGHNGSGAYAPFIGLPAGGSCVFAASPRATQAELRLEGRKALFTGNLALGLFYTTFSTHHATEDGVNGSIGCANSNEWVNEDRL